MRSPFHVDADLATGTSAVIACTSRQHCERVRRNHAALVFEQPTDVRACGHAMPVALVLPPIPQGKAYPERTGNDDIEFTERLSA